MLQYLVKHCRPGNENATHELLKVVDRANLEAYWEMHHVLKYLLDTKNWDWRSSQTWKRTNVGTCFCDSNYADQDTR